ncbi:MAG: recombinase RecA [Oscillospiraceae bacterium]|nr:recombinase RecA [Oscillospiraceae bacterium]
MAEKKKNDKKMNVVQGQKLTDEEKRKALSMAIAQLEKQYGKGAVMRLGEAYSYNVDHIPTGSMTLDLALGIGGVPRGRIVEVYGPESSGKTTVALQVVAEAQKLGGTAAFIDVEHALDPVYAKALGVDVDNLLVSQPDSGEQALEIMESLVRSGAIDCIVLDSVAAMVTKAEIDGEMGDTHVGQLARLMSQAMRKLTSVISKTNCVAIFINQVREKIGVMYGNPETTPGGRALKFYASVRIEVRKSEVIKNGSEIVGNRTKCKIVKNKVAPPFKECEFDMLYGQGVSRTGEVIDMAAELDVVKKSGAWYSYKDQKIGQGREAAKDYIKNNPEVMKEIEEQVLANIDKLVMTSKKNKKSAAIEAAAEAAAEAADNIPIYAASPADDTDDDKKSSVPAVDIDADDDFEEFTPIDT